MVTRRAHPLMHQRTAPTSLRRVAHPLTLAAIVAVAGVVSALIALAVRGHFSTVSAPPVAAITPSAAASASASPSAPAAAQTVSGTLASTLVLAMSSDETGTITVDAGTPIQATTGSGGTVASVTAGSRPPGGGGGENGGVSGSTATPATLVVDTGSGTVTLTIPQDSSVTGTLGRHTALQITAPQQ